MRIVIAAALILAGTGAAWAQDGGMPGKELVQPAFQVATTSAVTVNILTKCETIDQSNAAAYAAERQAYQTENAALRTRAEDVLRRTASPGTPDRVASLMDFAGELADNVLSKSADKLEPCRRALEACKARGGSCEPLDKHHPDEAAALQAAK